MTRLLMNMRGILMTVLTERMMSRTCLFTPGASPNPWLELDDQPTCN